MFFPRGPANFFWILTFLSVLSAIVFITPELPNPMVSHFDFQGQPNGSMSPWGFASVLIAVILFINVSSALIYKYAERMPSQFLNVPDKEAWLQTPELKALMYERVRTVLAGVGLYTNLLLLYCFIRIVDYHKHQQEMKGIVWYVLISSAMLVTFSIAYLKPPRSPKGPRPT